MPINPSLERKLASMKDEVKAIRDKHDQDQAAKADQASRQAELEKNKEDQDNKATAASIEIIKNKRQQMLDAAKKSDEIKSRQNEELDVTMLIDNMIAEAADKKPPVGQGGRDYEEHINGILKKHGKADKDAKTAGSSADAPDAQFNHNGKKHNLEIKADHKAMFGQMELKHDGEKWDFSERSKKKYPETHKHLVKSGFLHKVNKQWGKPTGKYEDDLKMGNVYHTTDNADPIKAHYGKDRKTDYIQIGKGHGFYHTGNDAAKLGSPELHGKTQIRARMKARGRDKDGNRTYGALAVMALKDAPKSHHDLEKEVHKEWIDSILNGPNVISEGLGRGREDDEYHVPDPVDTRTHKIGFHVSKEGIGRHHRTVTISNSTKSEEEAKQVARAHLERQGYKIHEETEIAEARMSAAVKLQRAFEREQQKSVASRARAEELLKRKEEPKKVQEGLKPDHNMRPGWMLKADPELAAKVKKNKDIFKARRAAYGNPNAGKPVKEETAITEGAYEKAEENKRSADAAKKQGDMFAHHLHMADHHDNLAQWHAEKGRHGEADRHAQKSDEHHEKAMSLKESVLNPKDPHGDYKAKSKALQDLSMNKDVDQAHVQQRKLDLDKEYSKYQKEEVELDEAIKIGSKVKVHAPGKDYHDQVGHVGEIRHGAFKGAPKTYTVDYADGKSVQLDKKNVKLHTEEVAANSVAGGGVAGLKGDAGKKSVMTKEPLKRKALSQFKTFVSQEHDK